MARWQTRWTNLRAPCTAATRFCRPCAQQTALAWAWVQALELEPELAPVPLSPRRDTAAVVVVAVVVVVAAQAPMNT